MSLHPSAWCLTAYCSSQRQRPVAWSPFMVSHNRYTSHIHIDSRIVLQICASEVQGTCNKQEEKMGITTDATNTRQQMHILHTRKTTCSCYTHDKKPIHSWQMVPNTKSTPANGSRVVLQENSTVMAASPSSTGLTLGFINIRDKLHVSNIGMACRRAVITPWNCLKVYWRLIRKVPTRPNTITTQLDIIHAKVTSSIFKTRPEDIIKEITRK